MKDKIYEFVAESVRSCIMSSTFEMIISEKIEEYENEIWDKTKERIFDMIDDLVSEAVEEISNGTYDDEIWEEISLI